MDNPEPVIDLDDVQGNIYPGFNKDHQTLRFLEIADAPVAKLALADLVQDISTSTVVQGFAATRAAIKTQRNGGPSGLSATWVNIAFSYGGLAKLAPAGSLAGLDSPAFRLGLAARSALLGDATTPGTPGHPAGWSIGAPGGPTIEIVVTIAGDQRSDVDAYAASLMAKLAAYLTPDGGPALRSVCPDLLGDTLGGDLNGHEHFGFKDGVSQPALRGSPSSAPGTFITPRIIDPSSPLAKLFGRPGQRLLWPGQALLGQPKQNGMDPLTSLPAESVNPVWLRNGSFMVLRLLQQFVPAFWDQMRSYAQTVLGKNDPTSTEWVAARVIGRWPSGAPLIRTPNADNPAFINDNRIANDFGFRVAGTEPVLLSSQPVLPTLPLGVADPDGNVCPFAGHIRKVNPRDDSVEQGSPGDTLTRLLFRRGIPYGPRLDDPRSDSEDGQERGLIFVAYQSSFELQFEFLMQNWVNGDDAPHVGGGRDGLLGRHGPLAGFDATAITVVDPAGAAHVLPQVKDFIIPRGGGYFFAPSMTGLRVLAGLASAALVGDKSP